MTNSTDLTAFNVASTAMANSDLFAKMMAETDALANTGGSVPRISIKGGRFREIVGGEQVRVNSSGSMDVVILRISGINRTYFEGAYDPEKSTPPACWSTNQETPSADVPEETRQAPSCRDCPMNIRGSGTGDSRACRYSIRTAICLAGNLDTVYQFQIPATSIFGEAKGGDMAIQAYARYLKANGLAMAALVTKMTFDIDSETPKLYFSPVRPLTEEELEQAVASYGSDAAESAVTLTVFKKPDDDDDDEAPAAKPTAKAAAATRAKAAAAKANPAPEPEVEDGDDEDGVEDAEIVPEPKKVSAKKKAPEADAAIADALSGWD